MKFFSLVIFLILIYGCSLRELKQQVETVEDVSLISGMVENSSGVDGPVLVVLLEPGKGTVRWVNHYIVSNDQKFRIHTSPGVYTVGAFVDTNNDGKYQRTEPATYLGIEKQEPETFVLAENDQKEIRGLSIAGVIEHTLDTKLEYDQHKSLENIGKVVSLDDPMFNFENASLGLWRPVEFLDQIGGGLYLLDEYEEGKIPVVFVHGINGTPLNWKRVIEVLDKEKFQPFILFYPSGLRLDTVSDYFLKSMNELIVTYEFPEFYVAAHSMGGLVTHSFVKKYEDSKGHSRLTKVITVNSPMLGMKSAVSGVKHSPIVVPAWRDVAFQSEFVQDLNEWQWPSDVPYHMFFSFLIGEDGDGVVPLDSQIPRNLQEEAVAIYGFVGEHTAVLSNNEFIAKFHQVLGSP